ncbi:MAG: triose-phosphate isomerase [Myxococcaceae bacterium]
MVSRKPIVAGNWKMNKTVAEALGLVRDVRDLVANVQDVEVVLAPPFTAIEPVHRALEESNIGVAGQNCHWEPSGAFTGEISAGMLKEAGCRYVIVGHSERRQYFGETDETVNRRAHAVLREGLHPIICVGETLAEREAGKTLEVVSRQLKGALAGFNTGEVLRTVIAYEPVWAIGTGRTATSDQAQEVHAHIRESLIELFDRPSANAVRIQYGGSVKADNAAEIMSKPDVDGALVGGASLKPSDFAAIVRAASSRS